jgi:hypothetical protein
VAEKLDHEIWKLAMLVEHNSVLGKSFDIVNRSILPRVSDIEHTSAWCPARTELLENVANQEVLATWTLPRLVA